MAIISQETTESYSIINGDCIEAMSELPKECIDLSLYSPPFATSSGGLYVYSSSERDLSNSPDYGSFFDHYAFVVKEIYRLTKPGRITAVHCMDIMSGNSGNDYRIDFPGDIIRLHEKHGFKYVGRYCIWKEPLTVRNRTMMKTLMHTNLCEDSTKINNASADYLLIFRRKGTNKVQVTHPNGIIEYSGSRGVPNDLLYYKGHKNPIENKYSHWIWRQYASSFWDDIRLDRVLPFREAKDEEDEKHVHPLQLDVIDRCAVLWSNPGETILTPFMGVGSEVYGAVMNGRRAVGIELKTSYYNQAKKNLDAAMDGCQIDNHNDDIFGDTIDD